MKKTIFFTAFMAFFIMSVDSSAQAQERDYYTLEVDGLGCPFCAYGLEKKFKEFKGIKDVTIDIETGFFSFSFPDDEPLSVDRVLEQVNAAGYTPRGVTIDRTDGSTETNRVELKQSKLIEGHKIESFKVGGNCDLCKQRIELAALNQSGVSMAKYNVDEKVLEIGFDESAITSEEIQRQIAKVGHDTEGVKAERSVYKSLPDCCRYKRLKN